MHCNNPEKVSTLNRYYIFIMFVYIHSTHVMYPVRFFSSGKIKSGEGYSNIVASFWLNRQIRTPNSPCTDNTLFF